MKSARLLLVLLVFLLTSFAALLVLAVLSSAQAATPVVSETDWTHKTPAASPPALTFAPNPCAGIPSVESAAMAYDAARGDVVLFGGLVNVSPCNQTWVWNGLNWTQRFPALSPPPRFGHSMAFDAMHGQIVMFGGEQFPAVPLADTWVWDGSNWTQEFPANSPPPASGAAMAYDAARENVALFAGPSDTWVWDGSNWTQKFPANSPLPARLGAAMTYDAARGQVILFGGVSATGLLSDTWTWNGTNWGSLCTSCAPPARTLHTMAYDIRRKQIVMFGGVIGSAPTGLVGANDTWILDDRGWHQRTFPAATDVPPKRWNHVMAYDAARGQIVLFGGFGFNDTWLWSEEFRIFPIGTGVGTGIGSEPSIAVDPLNPLHAVVGFNDASNSGAQCGWAETGDGGATWTKGHVPLPAPFVVCSDPWVRFGPDGTLFYSGVGGSAQVRHGSSFTTEIGIVVGISSSPGIVDGVPSGGLAGDFLTASTVTTVKQSCGFIDVLLQRCLNFPFTDHPSITVIKTDGGFRAVVAWATFPNGQQQPRIEVSSYNGLSWSPAMVIGHGTGPIVGGDESQAAVTWFENDTLLFKASTDGQTWDPITHTLATTDPLFGPSTTDKVLASPYALVIPGQVGLRAVWQVRTLVFVGEISQVFLGDLVDNSSGDAIGNANTETFLPGAGACPSVAGAYQVTTDAGLFRYTVWLLGSHGGQRLLFTSGAVLDGHNGFPVTGFPGKINDYTGADCSPDFAWAAWTDLRNGITGKPEIWGARLPLPQ